MTSKSAIKIAAATRQHGLMGGLATIAFLSLAFIVPSPALAASTTSCTWTLDASSLGGIAATASAGVTGSWASSLAGIGAPNAELIQGGLAGTFTYTPTSGTVTGGAVTGGWSFNPATGKLLMKVFAVTGTFYIDFAFLNLPSPGFTFQGSLHVVGQQPIALVMEPPAVFPKVACV